VIVGCDYSTKAVDLAYLHPLDEGVWYHKKIAVNGLDKECLDAINYELEFAMEGFALVDHPVIYIEQPWSRYNQATAMQMVKVATAVEVLGKLAGYRVEWAHVASWRSAVFGKGKYDKATAKRLSREWAVTHTGLAIVSTDDNAADACCIAAFGEFVESSRA